MPSASNFAILSQSYEKTREMQKESLLFFPRQNNFGKFCGIQGVNQWFTRRKLTDYAL